MYALMLVYGRAQSRFCRRVLLPLALAGGLFGSFWFIIVSPAQVEPVIWWNSVPFGLRFAGAFAFGVAVNLWALERFLSMQASVLAFMALGLLTPYPDVTESLSLVVLPYAVLSFGLSRTPLLGWSGRYADLSFGVYLWGCPIQQIVISAFGPTMHPLLLLGTPNDARVQAMLGPDVPFELEWVSVYTFRCRRLERFVHGRVLFVGDSAHQVSPFGARGGNGGVQDADNLAWKLAAVVQGRAPIALVHTYDDERIPAADENILNSTRATDFITPKTDAARAYRDAALALAGQHAFARPLVNSGRLSHPARLPDSPLNADGDLWPDCLPPGTPAADAPVLHHGRPDWLLRHLSGPGFTLLAFGPDVPALPGVSVVRVAPDALQDVRGLATARYGAPPGACVLLRPDQHVAAGFRAFDARRIAAAVRHATAQPDPAQRAVA